MPHVHEKIDFTADVFVVCDDKVLIRKHDKYNSWLAVGGHIELDEDPNIAAVREVKEEVGLDVELVGEIAPILNERTGYRELMSPRFMNIHPISETHQHISMVYFARSRIFDCVESEAEMSRGLKWMTKEELLKNEEGVPPGIQYYALAALREVAGVE